MKGKRTTQSAIGVIGGSGLYDIEGLNSVRRVQVRTPFGSPSDSITVGTLEGVGVAFTTEGDTDRLTLTYDDTMSCLSQRQRDEYNLTAKADGRRTWHMAHGTCPDMEVVVDMELHALALRHSQLAPCSFQYTSSTPPGFSTEIQSDSVSVLKISVRLKLKPNEQHKS